MICKLPHAIPLTQAVDDTPPTVAEWVRNASTKGDRYVRRVLAGAAVRIPPAVAADPPGSARSVQSLGTTAVAAESLGNPEWTADLEHVWRSRTAETIASLETRARKRRRFAASVSRAVDPGRSARVGDARIGVHERAPNLAHAFGSHSGPALRLRALRSAEWASDRARALAMSREDVLATCNKRMRTVACGCKRFEVLVGCDLPQLCPKCRKRHARKWRVRIVQGMDLALRSERARWHRYPRHGMLPGIYLVTLTAPHSGDLEQDRIRMGKAVRKLLKHAGANGWWRHYALTWEATAGTTGDGHMHCHLAVVSSWVPYTSAQATVRDPEAWRPRRKGERRYPTRGLREVWADAMPGAVIVDVQAPRKGADDASTAGVYLAKYVTKGVDSAVFTGRKAGELLCAFRGRRKVTTSAHFWVPRVAECECCNERWRSVGAPESLQSIAPAAVLRAMSEKGRYRDPGRHGPPQVGLRWGARAG